MDIFEKPIAAIEKKHLPYRATDAYESWVRDRAGTLRAALLSDGGHRHSEVARFVDEWADILEALHVGRTAVAEAARLRAFTATVGALLEDSRRLTEEVTKNTEEVIKKDQEYTEEIRKKMKEIRDGAG